MSRKARRRPSWKHKNPAYRYNYFVLGGRRVWIAKRKIVARKRALKGEWTFETSQETEGAYGLNLEEELADILTKEIEAESQREYGKSSEEFEKDWIEEVKGRMRDYIYENKMEELFVGWKLLDGDRPKQP